MKYILFFIISMWVTVLQAQEDTLQIEIEDSFTETSEKKPKRNWHIGIGTDLAAPVSSLFSDRTGFSLLVDLQLFPKWFIQSQFGNEKNAYDDIGWKVDAQGNFFKIGANYIIVQHAKNPLNQFFVGLKIAYSGFKQNLNQVPIRALGQTTQYLNLGEDQAAAYWLEIPLGARVNILKEKLYLESIMTTNILMDDSSEVGVDPVVIPNFGRNNGNLNFNIFWGVSYFLK